MKFLGEKVSEMIEIKKKAPELLDYIRENLNKNQKLEPVIGKKGKGVIVLKDLIEVKHPILNKLVDYGNMSRKLNNELGDLIKKMVDQINTKERADLKMLVSLAEEFLKKVRELSVEFILRGMLETENDLRPLMMPGSVGRTEIPNLYMPMERYSEKDRIKLALQLLESVAIGNYISVHFEGRFQEYLEQLIRSKFDRMYLEGKDIKAVGWEMDKPFVILLRLILWVYSQIAEKGDREEIIEMMKSSSGVIYFTPGDKERYTAFFFPQLNRFVDTWLLRKNRRNALEEMLNSLKVTSSAAYEKEKDVIKNQIELIYSYLNLLAISLIERASILWEPLRKVVDLVIDLAGRYDVPANFHFIKMLGEAYGLESPQRSGEQSE